MLRRSGNVNEMNMATAAIFETLVKYKDGQNDQIYGDAESGRVVIKFV